MKRFLAAAGGVVLLAAFGALAYFNPSEAEFHFSPTDSIRLPLGWLLVFTLVTGALLVMLLSGIRQLGLRLAGFGERRRARQAVRVGEWQESGATLAWDGDVERGRALLRKAWRRQSGNSAAALALATSYMDTGEYSGAREVLEEAIAQDVNDADLRFALGETLRRAGEHGEAIRMLESVRVQHPRAPRALVSLRELYRETGRWHDAAQVQAAYVEALPTGSRASEEIRLRDLRFQAALANESATARVDALTALLETHRDFVPAAISLGDALAQDNRLAEAKKVWEKTFKSQPDLPLLQRLLDHAEGRRERDRALGLLNKYRQQLDEDAVHLLLARDELANGNPETAATELGAIGQQDNPAVQRCWAELHHRRGQHEEAWKVLSALADRELGRHAAA